MGLPSMEASRHLRWLGTPIVFSSENHPKSMAGVEKLPSVIYPTICNMRVINMLVDGGAILNLLSPAIFEKMQVPPGSMQTHDLFQVLPRGSPCDQACGLDGHLRHEG